ncbi:MAG: T9SS type A sorting domain-containing protein [Rhodothermales bacterium]
MSRYSFKAVVQDYCGYKGWQGYWYLLLLLRHDPNAYPNPFNPTTTVTYGLPSASEVRLTATDLLGRQVATLVAGDMKSAGYYTVQFNADGLASGTYLIRMEAGDFVATQQVVLLK